MLPQKPATSVHEIPGYPSAAVAKGVGFPCWVLALRRTPLKAKAIPRLVAKALAALDALPDADDPEILLEDIRAQHSLMPWRQVQIPPCNCSRLPAHPQTCFHISGLSAAVIS